VALNADWSLPSAFRAFWRDSTTVLSPGCRTAAGVFVLIMDFLSGLDRLTV
jgi:hypothetical protein